MRTAELTLPPTEQPEPRSDAERQMAAEPRIPAEPKSPVEPRPPVEPTPSTELLASGTRVDVRNRLDGRWAKGFEVVESSADGYQLRRTSDGFTLPMVFATADVRPERRRSNWWY